MCVQDFVGVEGRVPVLKENSENYWTRIFKVCGLKKALVLFFVFFTTKQSYVFLRKSQVPWAVGLNKGVE